MTAGDGVTVEGIGTVERPYEITVTATDLAGRVVFDDTESVDFTTSGVGSSVTPLIVSAHATLAVTDLIDVADPTGPNNGEVAVWHTDHWEFDAPKVELPVGGSTGQVLAKKTATDGDVQWSTLPTPPDTGHLTVADTATLDLILTGSGSTASPYLLKGDVLGGTGGGSSDITGKLTVTDTPTIDLTLTGSGTTASPYSIKGAVLGVVGERTYASARRCTTAVSFATGVNVAPPMDFDEYTDGIPWDSTNNLYTVPVAGYYKVEGALHWSSNATGNRTIRLLVNGSPLSVTQGGASSVAGSSGWIAATFKLAAGDTVTMQGAQGSGATLVLTTNSSFNFFKISKIPAPVVNGQGLSGVWGAPPLNTFGANSLVGREVYLDSAGQLRAKPDSPVVDCTAECVMCTSVATAANAGSTIASRYVKQGKQVSWWGNGKMGTGAVTGAAILLPPSAGVPAWRQSFPAPSVILAATPADVTGGTIMTADLTRVVFNPKTSGVFVDFLANTDIRWSYVYEVL